MYYSETLQQLATMICSDYLSSTASTIERTIRSRDPGNDGVGTVLAGSSA
jgi:hypothetical protein